MKLKTLQEELVLKVSVCIVYCIHGECVCLCACVCVYSILYTWCMCVRMYVYVRVCTCRHSVCLCSDVPGTVFLISLYGAPLAKITSYLSQHNSLFGAAGVGHQFIPFSLKCHCAHRLISFRSLS